MKSNTFLRAPPPRALPHQVLLFIERKKKQRKKRKKNARYRISCSSSLREKKEKKRRALPNQVLLFIERKKKEKREKRKKDARYCIRCFSSLREKNEKKKEKKETRATASGVALHFEKRMCMRIVPFFFLFVPLTTPTLYICIYVYNFLYICIYVYIYMYICI